MTSAIVQTPSEGGSIPAGFTWSSTTPDRLSVICPEGHMPEKRTTLEEAGTKIAKLYYPEQSCSHCNRKKDCCPLKRRKVLTMDITSASNGLKTRKQFFNRYPMARGLMSVLQFRHQEHLVCIFDGETFEVDKEAEADRLWYYLLHSRVVYTDGSHSPKTGVCGCAYVSISAFGDFTQKSFASEGTSLDAELDAATQAIEDAISERCPALELRSDNAVLIQMGNGMSALNAAKTCSGVEFLDALDRARKLGMKLRFRKVKGHSGEPGNALADFFAGALRKLTQTDRRECFSSLWKEGFAAPQADEILTDPKVDEVLCRADEVLTDSKVDEVLCSPVIGNPKSMKAFVRGTRGWSTHLKVLKNGMSIQALQERLAGYSQFETVEAAIAAGYSMVQ